MNSLARSNASIYGNKEDLYDRLKRHAYPGKKGDVYILHPTRTIAAYQQINSQFSVLTQLCVFILVVLATGFRIIKDHHRAFLYKTFK